MSKTADLVLYSRPGCHLCEDMVLELDTLVGRYDFDFRVVDVSMDSDLEARFGLDVPVLCDAQGVLVCQHRLDSEALERALSGA